MYIDNMMKVIVSIEYFLENWCLNDIGSRFKYLKDEEV